MKRWVIIAPLVFLVLVATTFISGWYTLPYWLPAEINKQLAPHQYRLTEIAFERPTLSEWRIQQLTISKKIAHSDTFEASNLVTLSGVVVQFELSSLLNKTVDRLDIEEARLSLPSNANSNAKKVALTPLKPSLIEDYLAGFIQLWPLTHVEVSRFIVTGENPLETSPSPAAPNGFRVPHNQAKIKLSTYESHSELLISGTIEQHPYTLSAQLENELSLTLQSPGATHNAPNLVDLNAKISSNRLMVSGSHSIALAQVVNWLSLTTPTLQSTLKQHGVDISGNLSGNWNAVFNETVQLSQLEFSAAQQFDLEMAIEEGIAKTVLPLQLAIANQQIAINIDPTRLQIQPATSTLERLSHRFKWPLGQSLPNDWNTSINQPVSLVSPLSDLSSWSISPIVFSINQQPKDSPLAASGTLHLNKVSPFNGRLDLTSHLTLSATQWPTQISTTLSATLAEVNSEWTLAIPEPITSYWKEWLIQSKDDNTSRSISAQNGQLTIAVSDAVVLDSYFLDNALSQARKPLAGNATLSFTPNINGQALPPATIKTSWQLRDDELQLPEWAIHWDELFASGHAQHDLTTQQGQSNWRLQLPNAYRWLDKVNAPIPSQLRLTQGDISGNGEVNWNTLSRPTMNAKANIAVDNWSGDWNKLPFMEASISSELSLSENMDVKGEHATASIAYFDPGIPIETIAARFSWMMLNGSPDTTRIDVDHLSADLLSGSVFNQKPFTLSPFNLDTQIDLQLQNIGLADILALEQQPIKGEGLLEGTIPLQLTATDIIVNDGQIVAKKPGGWIKLEQSDSFKQMANNNPNLKLALGALENFRYQLLESQVDYQTNGDLVLGVELDGRNPDFNGGQSFSFNITIEENLKALFKSIQLTDEITQRIRKKYHR